MSASMKLSKINEAKLKPAVTFAVIAGKDVDVKDVADVIVLSNYIKDKHADMQLRTADAALVNLLQDEGCPFVRLESERTAQQEKELRNQVTLLTKRTKKAKFGFKWLKMATGEWTWDFTIDGKCEARPDDLTLVVVFTPDQAIEAFGSEVNFLGSSGKNCCHLGVIATQSPYSRPHRHALRPFHKDISEAICQSIGLSTAVEESSDSEDDTSDSSEDSVSEDEEPELQDTPLTSTDDSFDIGGDSTKMEEDEPTTAEEAERLLQMGGYRGPSPVPGDITAPEKKAESADQQSGLPSPPPSQSDGVA